MLSDLIFIANDRVKNRFLLCHLVRISSRRFHQKGVPMQETINKVFGLVSDQGYRAGTLDLKGEWESSFTSSALGYVEAKLAA
jgi:hypothetical protein